MIDFYTWTTPNGRKISIMLEETGLDYAVHPVNIGKGEQFAPEFLKVSPNNKIPAIVDHDTLDGPVSIFESGAILIHLAEKSGKFLPHAPKARGKVLEWLMWQMGGFGPMLGQANHFINAAPEPVPYAVERFLNESARLYAVMDKRLGEAEFLGGEYSIADMAAYPWAVVSFENIKAAKPEQIGEGANVARWLAAVGARAGVQRGMKVPQV